MAEPRSSAGSEDRERSPLSRQLAPNLLPPRTSGGCLDSARKDSGPREEECRWHPRPLEGHDTATFLVASCLVGTRAETQRGTDLSPRWRQLSLWCGCELSSNTPSTKRVGPFVSFSELPSSVSCPLQVSHPPTPPSCSLAPLVSPFPLEPGSGDCIFSDPRRTSFFPRPPFPSYPGHLGPRPPAAPRTGDLSSPGSRRSGGLAPSSFSADAGTFLSPGLKW